MPAAEPRVERVDVAAYRVPTDGAESDGTLQWDATTMIAVHVRAGGRTGFGYTYAHKAAGTVIQDVLARCVIGVSAMDVRGAYRHMAEAIRNNGDGGLARMAVSAVDVALWDLKARLLDMPLCTLLGRRRDEVAAYGSGGFTSYTAERLRGQLGQWAAEGFQAVKMKIGRDPPADPDRVRTAREAVGQAVELFVDANGAYSPRQAVAMAHELAPFGVTWFEEPVSHQDLGGLALVRQHVPPAMAVAAGEYGYGLPYFRRILEAKSVDVLMADATRCGITGFLDASVLCEAHGLPLSSHCAPSVHLHPCLAAGPVRHMEYFHDHVRVEHMLLDGAAAARGGRIAPDLGRPGLGLELKLVDAERWEA